MPKSITGTDSGRAEALRRIKTCRECTQTALDLRGLKLFTLPQEIGSLAALTTLDLNDNALTALPLEIGSLTALKELNLGRNRLTALPPEIGSLTALKELNLGYNALPALPPEIGSLTALTTLDLSRNRLTALPPEIGSLTALEELNLGYNRLTALPPEIGSLTALKELNLNDNALTALPPEIGALTALTTLDIGGNLELGIPPEVLCSASGVGASPQKIIAWYLRNRAAKARCPILEAKVILVGWGAVGKTSLRRRLLDDTFNEQEETTHKIEIHPWKVTVGTDPVKLHVWDFGGQEIMHATHQFFLTKRSLYVLVLAGREKIQGANDAEYWLRLIKSFGGDSPVIIALNKQHGCPFDLNRQSLQEKYPFVRGFIQTDCEPILRLDELKELILREVDHLPDLRTMFDAKWMAIKDEVTDLKIRGRRRLTVEDYFRLCHLKEEPDEKWQKWLLSFLHDLGVVVCFHDDPRLANDGVLDPQWVVDGIYKVLTEPTLTGADGRVTHAQIRDLLPAHDYANDDVRILLDLMVKFGLCFWLNDSRNELVVPELMTEQEADWKQTFANSADGLRFELKYEFLPEGLMPRFIVGTHDLSRSGERWRSGVILRNKEGNAALVRGDATGSPPRVHIIINGPVATRRELLAIVRREFEKINASVPGLEVKERVPIPGYNVDPPNYDTLLAFELDGEKTWNFVVNGAVIRIPIAQLLDGIEPKPKRVARAKQLVTGMVVHGDFIQGDKHVQEENYTNSGNNQGIIGKGNQQTITNSFNHCADPTAAERELTQLKQFLAELLPKMPEEKRAEAEIHGETLEESAKKNDLKSRAKYGISAKGLLEAAKWVKDFSGNLGGTLLSLGRAIWPDYSLPT